MLRNLQLSETERTGMWIEEQQMDVADGAGKVATEPKVVVKVLAERPVPSEGLKQEMGPIWCPIRGIKCKKIDENTFMITLLQNSGKKKALDCGPCKFGNDLVVVEDYDAAKSVEEYAFSTIPIWTRVLKLPLGNMNKATGEMIGEKIGEWMDADVGEDDFASGEVLRIKVLVMEDEGAMEMVGQEAPAPHAMAILMLQKWEETVGGEGVIAASGEEISGGTEDMLSALETQQTKKVVEEKETVEKSKLTLTYAR
ncbi:hypothetical protein QYE76_071349 [Lolium multiflorum]|uniref:DUF4283 domain-containing protein n=1 Tax=Lolium multiflorum TaxID=4521 RepID=A0AAD8SL13_LOLMU|nr:hypothetical protein QYE76_071349 [Lolium multiflorum]